MIKKILTIYALFVGINASGITLETHVNRDHQFSLSYPSDWTVKAGTSESTAFKAVKKFPSGNYLMLTVTAQPLGASGDSTDNYSIDDIAGLAKRMYGEQNVKLLKSSRGSVGGRSTIRLLMDIHPPSIQPRIEESFFVFNGQYLYSAAVSYNKPLHSQYSVALSKLLDSFVFLDAQKIVDPFKATTTNPQITLTDSGEKPLPAFSKTFGGLWAKNITIAVLIVIGSAIGVLIKGKKNNSEHQNNTEEK